jgi:hypothetical protein
MVRTYLFHFIPISSNSNFIYMKEIKTNLHKFRLQFKQLIQDRIYYSILFLIF